MLHQGVQYPANTKGRLDNIGCVFPDVLDPLLPLDSQQVLADLDLAVTNARHVNDRLAALLQVLGKLATLLLRRGQDGSLDGLAVLLVEGAKLLLLDLDLPLLDDLGLIQALPYDKRRAGLLGMD